MVAGPPSPSAAGEATDGDGGGALADGWVHTHLLSEAAREMVSVHACML
jgi:hypothetical protein